MTTLARCRVVVLGCGGHARVCIDALLLDPAVEVVGATGTPIGDSAIPIPLLGTDDVLPELRSKGVTHAFVAIGDNTRRLERIDAVTNLGFELVTALHPRAVVAAGVVVGPGTAVMAGAVVNPGTVLARGVIVNTAASVDHDCRIDDGAHLCPGSHLAGNVVVGARSMIGSGAAVIPGTCIGRDCVIGAGAAVVTDIAHGVTAVGVPARPLAARVPFR